jgi:hypothetical protein
VSTEKKSHAIMLAACARMNSRHVGCERWPAGPSPAAWMSLRTVVPDTAWPTPFSSPAIR